MVIINALIFNDLASLWEGPESFLAWRALHDASGFTPHELISGALLDSTLSNLFWFRFPPIVAILSGGILFWYAASPIFGNKSILNTIFLGAASLLIVNIAKIATGDIWALLSQWLTFIVLVRYLKQPKLQWQIAFYVLMALSIWIQPAQSLLFLLCYATWLYIKHPNGKRLWKLNPWIFSMITFGVLYMMQWAVFSQHSFLFGFNSLKFLSWNLIGILPFIGFALAGIWETIQKARKGEELAIILSGALLFSLLAHSMAFQMILAMLAARQLEHYFAENYPYKDIVRGGTVLHLIFAVLIIIVLLMGAFFQFKGPGFRAGLAAGGIYWMWSVVAVIGLYGMNARYVRAGTIFSGIFFVSLFWLQVVPVLETRWQWHKELLLQITESSSADENIKDNTCLVYNENKNTFPALATYAKANFPKTVLLDDQEATESIIQSGNSAYFILPVKTFEAVAITVDSTHQLKGWNHRFKNVHYGWLKR